MSAESQGFLAERPDSYLAFHRGGETATQVADELRAADGGVIATVTSRSDPFMGGRGDWRQNFRALAITGDTYSGTAYLDAGTHARIRKLKAPKAAKA